jgi:glutathione S-transferase
MRLLIHPASPNCVALLAVAKRLGVPLDVQHVDLFNGEQRTPAYLALNPNGMVPVLCDGDFVLWETVAILAYLADLDANRQLLPGEARPRAEVMRWLAWGLAHWNPALQPFIFERMFKPMKGQGTPDEELLKSALPRLNRAAAILDGQLGRNDFLCGNALTVADFYVAAYPMYAEAAGIDLEAFPNLRSWLQRMYSLKEWQEAVKGGAA